MKRFLCLSAIVLIGLFLRLIFIDKPDGLWNDEMVSWIVASMPLYKGFIEGIKSQCHMPFYYLYLKLFIKLFGSSDMILRLTSVLAGVAAIPIMYFVGKENDTKTGYYCAGFCAISSFLIYYSQEVRLYSLLFAFSALSLLFTIKLLKDTNLKNAILYGFSNFLILITHTIGFVYVFFNLLFVSIYLFKQNKKQIIAIWLSLFAIFLSIVPFLIRIFTTKSFSQWWGSFSFSKIGFLITDYFSPIITNLTNSPDEFFYAGYFIVLMLIPSIIAIFLIIMACLKNKQNLYLLILSCSVVLVLIIASLSDRLVLLTKYSIEIYPILIYLACFGLQSVKNSVLKISIILIYSIISVGYIIFFPQSAPKMHRAEGHKIPMEMLYRSDIKQGDYIILLYYPKQRFEKYFDFSKYNVISMDKGNFFEYIAPSNSYSDIYKNGKELYRKNFSEEKNLYLNKTLDNRLSLQTNQSVILVILDSVSFYSPEEMGEIVQNETMYNKTPFLFLVFSYLKKETFEYLIQKYEITQIERKGKWTVVKFTKLNI